MNFQYENTLKKTGKYRAVAGVDEAGRGPLAGPVFACAFVFLHQPSKTDQARIQDSKLLSQKHREQCFEMFCVWKKQRVVDFATAFVQPATIDKHNIQYATVRAMKRAFQKLATPVDFVVVDWVAYQRYTTQLFPTQYEVKAKADRHIISVAAASIVSKVKRDAMMVRYHKQYPDYGFLSHKGYGTKAHYGALKKYGTSVIHRKSFRLS